MKCSKGCLATPPPFYGSGWSVLASGITASYGRAPNYSHYEYRIITQGVSDRTVGEWTHQDSWTELTDPGTYRIQIRPIISEVVPGAPSDKKTVVVS
jgi:hypothetical protein